MDYRFCIHYDETGLGVLDRNHTNKVGYADDRISVERYPISSRQLTDWNCLQQMIHESTS